MDHGTNPTPPLTDDFTGAIWRKSRRSAQNGGCVEHAVGAGGLHGLRDSKLGADSPVLVFTSHEWECFTGGVADGDFS